jgi:hypothetical protein
LLLILPGLGALAVEPEDEIKSVAVLNFLRYSTWPEPVPGTLTVGVLGRRSFLDALRATLESKPVNGRAVRVTEVKRAADVQECQMVYLATERSADIKPVLATAQSVRALTIGESDRFLDYGGAINLFLVDGHIGFEASLETIERTGVTVSSNLLRIGQIRGRARHGGPL